MGFMIKEVPSCTTAGLFTWDDLTEMLPRIKVSTLLKLHV